METGDKLIHKLGFKVLQAIKRAFVDLHECEDVVSYRKKFRRRLPGNAPTEDAEKDLSETENALARKCSI